MSDDIKSMILTEKYEVLQCLGEGTFATVRQAVDMENNQRVAIKHIYVQRAYLEDAEEQILKLKILSNDHIVKVKDFFYDSTEFYLNIVLELCNGSLRDQLKNQKIYSQAELTSFLIQIVSAFMELEKNKIMHLDFKPENVLLADDDGKHYKICDFGCSQISEISNLSGYENNVFGTFNYLAPEVYLNYKGQKHRNSADIWSVGVTLYQMLFRRLPFPKTQNGIEINRDLVEEYFEGKGYQLNYDIEEDGPKKIVELVKMMLKPKPSDRITWVELKKKLMNDFKIPEHLFMNIGDVINNFIPITQLFLKIVTTLNRNVSAHQTQFWTKNSQSLMTLREVLLYYFYIVCEQFGFNFEAKMECVEQEQARKVSQLLREIQNERRKCHDKIKTFEKKDINYRETQLLGEIKGCLSLFNKEREQSKSITLLSSFCKQLKQVVGQNKSLFGYGVFTSTLRHVNSLKRSASKGI